LRQREWLLWIIKWKRKWFWSTLKRCKIVLGRPKLTTRFLYDTWSLCWYSNRWYKLQKTDACRINVTKSVRVACIILLSLQSSRNNCFRNLIHGTVKIGAPSSYNEEPLFCILRKPQLIRKYC
jgi:hypothetical protein